MIFKLKNTIDATQITWDMLSGKEPLPNNVHRFCSSICGIETGTPQLQWIPRLLKDRKVLKIGDWVVNSIFSERVLSDKDFKMFVTMEVDSADDDKAS